MERTNLRACGWNSTKANLRRVRHVEVNERYVGISRYGISLKSKSTGSLLITSAAVPGSPMDCRRVSVTVSKNLGKTSGRLRTQLNSLFLRPIQSKQISPGWLF